MKTIQGENSTSRIFSVSDVSTSFAPQSWDENWVPIQMFLTFGLNNYCTADLFWSGIKRMFIFQWQMNFSQRVRMSPARFGASTAKGTTCSYKHVSRTVPTPRYINSPCCIFQLIRNRLQIEVYANDDCITKETFGLTSVSHTLAAKDFSGHVQKTLWGGHRPTKHLWGGQKLSKH